VTIVITNHNGCHTGKRALWQQRGPAYPARSSRLSVGAGCISQMIEADYDGIDPYFLFHLL